MNTYQIARMIDSTTLKPDSTRRDIETACSYAKKYGFITVAIGPAWIKYAKELLSGSETGVDAPVGFPNGYATTEVKVFETRNAIENGADDIDMVINIGWLKSGMYEEVKNEIQAVRNVCRGITLKVILETHYLTDEEKRIGAAITADAGADFVKTSTGYADTGCTEEDVKLLVDEVGKRIRVKASGGIRSIESLIRYYELGASRFGLSNAHEIIEQLEGIEKMTQG